MSTDDNVSDEKIGKSMGQLFIIRCTRIFIERRIIEMKKMFTAVRHNDLETVKQILDKTPEVINCVATPPPKKDEGQSPLQVAIKVGNLEIAHYLIDKGADVNHMEPDNGVPWNQGYRCPLLFDAIIGLYLTWERRREEKMELILRLLASGADPNKEDNRGFNSWDFTVVRYQEKWLEVKDAERKKIVTDMTKELLDALVKYDAEIMNIKRVMNNFKLNMNYSIISQNLILNRDDLYGISSDNIELCNRIWTPIIPVIKPYYKKNNPNYNEKG